MKAFADLALFVRAADAGSLSAAARALDISPAAASATLKRLEAELHAQLFVRSTRSLRLTQEGERFLAHAREALRAIEEAEQALRGDQAVLRGQLQLSMPSDLGRSLVLPWLDDFIAQHPHVQLRINLSDHFADVYRQPVDVALRYGAPQDSNLIALPLRPENRRVLCASPDYLSRRGVPDDPDRLSEHNCLRMLIRGETQDRWRLRRGEDDRTVRVQGDRVSDDGHAVKQWALAGHGIAYKSWLDVSQEVTSGRLTLLCRDWSGESAPLNLVCPDRRLLSPLVQRLREFLKQRFETVAPIPE
ncbi:LysR substrate-binding domain-containing protein [Lysobacter sp. CA199]|uniref:LysR family transcriptional regulator n=1 Tax=Lysobacter sp. CA199 TaxID=3455608 RepID=UPI003F8D34FF